MKMNTSINIQSLGQCVAHMNLRITRERIKLYLEGVTMSDIYLLQQKQFVLS